MYGRIDDSLGAGHKVGETAHPSELKGKAYKAPQLKHPFA